MGDVLGAPPAAPANQMFRTEDKVAEILAALPARVSDTIKPWAERSPDRLALVESGGTWTYRQLAAGVAETQGWLRQLGVRPGDRVMIVFENCRAFVAILLAAAELDAWPVLVNARLSAREVDEIQVHCGARRVLYTAGVSLPAREHAKRNGATVSEVGSLGRIGVGPLNEETQPEAIDPNTSDNVGSVIYTSGTTGLPKGVILTHRNLLFVAAVAADIRNLTPEDRTYGVLPMSHSVGLSVVLLGTLLSGATLYMAKNFDPVAALAALETHRLTVMLGAPAMFALLAEYAKLKGITSLKFPALRIISCSGAPLHEPVKSAVESLLGLVLHNGYGVSECSPNISQTRPEAPRSDTSVGRVFPGIEVALMGPDGTLVQEGEAGELWVRGPNVMKGYYRAPEETAAALNAEGWFNTRDLARFEDGNLFIVGRTKELIVRFGFNVYPAEVEAVLNGYPGVARSAVIGRSVDGDEEVVAFVQPSAGSAVTETELAAHAAKHLAAYKQPSQIVLLPTMPTTPTGKIRKDELSKMAADRTPAG
jgi:long-chain acyl-CoA synthetase